MHSRVFIIWLAATIAAAAGPPELRRPRQLDLGPDTNTLNAQPGANPSNPRQSNFQPQGYLPPIEPAGAQDDPVLLKPTQPSPNPTHHGRDLCTDPFHSFLCANLKPRRPITGDLPGQKKFELSGNILSGANSFLEPSKVLAPPLNDLEEPYTTTTRRPQLPSTTYRPIPTTTRRPPPPTTSYRPIPTTTRRPPPPTTTYRPPPTTTRRATTTYKPPSTTTRRPPPPPPTTTTTERPIGPEASNDVRSYLPPEQIDPAAAQTDITVVKPDAPEEHHHHPHHHGRDLCTDPFHSFLCAPLKPRKRITGDVPNSLQGQNSFLDPQKVRPEPEISPQPSNEIDRAYLPPTTTRKPTTTTTPRIIPQPSNEIERAYLPPSTTTRRPLPPPPPTFLPQPSNEIDRAYLPPATSTRRPPPPPPTTPRLTTTVRYRPEPSNEVNRAYIPPTTTTRRPLPTTTRRPPPTTTIRFRPEPSNEINRAYLPPVTTTRRPTTTTTPRPTPPIIPQPSNTVDRSYLPPVAPQPSNVDNTFLPPEPKIEPAAAQNDPAIATPDHDHDHHHGSHGFKDICSDPFHSFLCVSPKPRKRITGELPARFRTNAINPAPSNIDESRVRVLTHKTEKLRIVVIPKDVETPQPSQQQDTKIPFPSISSQNYKDPQPDLRLPLPSEAKEVGYTYPQPSTPKSTTTTGYSYPRPDNRLTQPSETKEVIGYDYPKPAKPFPDDKGYSYPKPDNKLTLPSEVKEVVGYDYPKPTTARPTTPRPTTIQTTTTCRPTTTSIRTTSAASYSYPKPENRLPLPSETKEVVGYDYPKPTVSFPPPTTGYSYPKPEKTLTLPTENKEVKGYDYPKPTVGLPLPTKGYDYPKPERRLTLPTDQRNSIRPLPVQTNAQRIANSYAKPAAAPSSSKSVLPTSIQEARERLQTKKVSSISSQNTLSDFIPVNKVEFPSDGELGVRFGERLKRRERGRHLIPPNGSYRL